MNPILGMKDTLKDREKDKEKFKEKMAKGAVLEFT